MKCQPCEEPTCKKNHALEYVEVLPDYYNGTYQCDSWKRPFLVENGVWHCSKCEYDINPGEMPIIVRKTLLRQYRFN